MFKEKETVTQARKYVQDVEVKHAATLFAEVFVKGNKERVALWTELQRLRVPKKNPHEK